MWMQLSSTTTVRSASTPAGRKWERQPRVPSLNGDAISSRQVLNNANKISKFKPHNFFSALQELLYPYCSGHTTLKFTMKWDDTYFLSSDGLASPSVLTSFLSPSPNIKNSKIKLLIRIGEILTPLLINQISFKVWNFSCFGAPQQCWILTMDLQQALTMNWKMSVEISFICVRANFCVYVCVFCITCLIKNQSS